MFRLFRFRMSQDEENRYMANVTLPHIFVSAGIRVLKKECIRGEGNFGTFLG